MDVKDYISTGNLQEALSAATSMVRQNPQDLNQRNLLWQLLCILGDWERADNQLDIIGSQNSEIDPRVNLYRWLIRAEQARKDCFNSDVLPEFMDKPTLTQQTVLKALIERRGGDMKKSMEFLQEAAHHAPVLSGTCNNKNFVGLRDCDDWCAFFLEVLTSKGKYYWIPFELISELKINPPQYLIDLLWRRTVVSLRTGIEGEIYLPTIYIDTPKEHQAAKLGHHTDWIIKLNEPVCGIGQRCFLIGDIEIPIMEIEQLTIINDE